MGITIIAFENQKTTRWSGGTTTELLILPKSAEFAKRNFDIRISTATIEIEESTFTELGAYLRKIMVLNGKLHLLHENQYSCTLNKFEQDSFSGAWKTTSVGKVTDFNVIFGPEFKPILETFSLQASASIDLSNQHSIFLFLVDGLLKIQDLEIEKQTSVYVENEKRLRLEALRESQLVIVKF